MLEYRGYTSDYSDLIFGQEDQNPLHFFKQPCVKSLGKKTSFNLKEGVNQKLSTTHPVTAEVSNEYQVKPELNQNILLALTGLLEKGFNRFNIRDFTTIFNTRNVNQEVFEL